ncbi:MalY/PatB family protein [Bacillus rubiinfantis]|uniref:MalY/PatB family protein n=1 Tax=Bacillus rubiinfantis TaxID=1499680 RepID=UPI0005A9C5E0|nr:PatB family C-S lyase [Bacillus rubiinfantis]
MSIFDEQIDRYNTASVKWEATKDVFGEADLWPMWVADMDFRPPEAVMEAIKKRAEHGVYGYTYIPASTKQAIEQWALKRHGWKIESSSMLFCSGVVQAISTAIQTFTEEGDRVLVQSPVYTPFFDMIENNKRIVVNAQLILKGNQYRIDFAAFEDALKQGCKLFLLCSPHNPGGRVWTKAELAKIGELCLKYNCLILSDEIHSDLVYKAYKHTPIASLSNELAENVITCIAPSKTFNIAGLQASVTIIKNKEKRERFEQTIRRQGFFSLNTFGIIAMEAAYREGEAWLEDLLDYIQSNKEIAVNFLQDNLPKITCVDSEGTYLLWLDCRGLGLSDEELRRLLIQKGQLALEPGAKYGPGGEGFVRMNIACPKDHLIEGLNRLKTALG